MVSSTSDTDSKDKNAQLEPKNEIVAPIVEEDVSDGVEDDIAGAGNGALISLHMIELIGSPIGDVKKKKKKKKSRKKKAEQTDPPRVGLSKLFLGGLYPEGELQPYTDKYIFSISHCNHFYLLFSATHTVLRQRRPGTLKGLLWLTQKKPITIFEGPLKYIGRSDAPQGSSFVLA